MRHAMLLRAILLLLTLTGIGRALADCPNGTTGTPIAAGTGNFGTQSSFTIAGNSQLVTATTGYKCTNSSLVNIAATNTIKVTVAASANGLRLYAPANGSIPASYVPYRICADQACLTAINVGSSYTWTQTTLLGLLGLFTGTDGSLPLYLATSLANVPAGTYTDTLTLNWNSSLCTLGIIVCVSYLNQSATTTLNTRLVVVNFCYIDNAPNLSFGSQPFASGFTSPVTSNTLSIRCSLSAAYTVNLASSNPLNGQYRQMSALTNGTTYYLQYQILKADATIWTPTNSYGAIGTGSSQAIGYTAQVNTSQANVPAGNYSDTVTVSVTY